MLSSLNNLAQAAQPGDAFDYKRLINFLKGNSKYEKFLTQKEVKILVSGANKENFVIPYDSNNISDNSFTADAIMPIDLPVTKMPLQVGVKICRRLSNGSDWSLHLYCIASESLKVSLCSTDYTYRLRRLTARCSCKQIQSIYKAAI